MPIFKYLKKSTKEFYELRDERSVILYGYTFYKIKYEIDYEDQHKLENYYYRTN